MTIVRLYQSLTIRPSIREAIECTHAIIVCMGFFVHCSSIRSGLVYIVVVVMVVIVVVVVVVCHFVRKFADPTYI